VKYLLRLDDAHEYMNEDGWNKFEIICDKYNIKPIVAIIPDNKDDSISFSKNIEFKRTIDRWKTKNWSFALHGYQHKLKKNKGSQLVNINDYSEFVGDSYETQFERIKKGYEILKSKGIDPKIWVAPAHGTDLNTLKAIKDSTSINIISDGFSIHPFKKYGFNWIPQQLWKPRSMPFGVWTICYHPSNSSESTLKKLDLFLSKNHSKFICVDQITYNVKRNFLIDCALKYIFIIKKIKNKVMK
ncbi:DUF2334 domain-containing protein, partial [Photobacterium angustum]